MAHIMKNYFQISFYVSSLVALIVGGMLLYIGLKHNAQEEFYSVESGQIDFAYVATVFFFWAAPVFILCMVIGALALLFYRLVARLSSNEGKQGQAPIKKL